MLGGSFAIRRSGPENLRLRSPLDFDPSTIRFHSIEGDCLLRSVSGCFVTGSALGVLNWMTMEPTQVRAFWLCNEIGLDVLAKHFGIARRSRWEDFLALTEENLTGILPDPKGRLAHLFPFGCIVCFGMGHHEVVDLVAYLRRLEPRLQGPSERYQEDCILEAGASHLEIRDDRVRVPSLDGWVPDILSTVLSKSVAFERIESEIERLMDEAEPVVQNLSSGKVSSSDGNISRLAGRILSFRLDTVSYIQLLDKPDATWDNPGAEDLYAKLSQFFELQDRYDKIQAKTTVLMDLTEVVTTYAHHHRGARLEWVIILLFAFEILFSLYEKFLGRGH